MLERIIIIGLLSNFILHLISKWGIREIMQQRGFKLLSEMATCDFCISFWINTIICVFSFIITKDIVYLYIPFFATPITRILI